MIIARKHDVDDGLRAELNSGDWPVFVCHHGVVLFDPREDDDSAPGTLRRAIRPPRRQILLPPCRARDEQLRQPPLGLKLTAADAAQLIDDVASAEGAAAATDYGPSAQDKCSNQDFAVAATLHINGQRVTKTLQFAAVADGVSTKTFWPERAARIAVIEAWRVARRHAEAGLGFTHEEFARFRKALASAVTTSLLVDQELLRSRGSVPPGWDPATFKRFCRRDELWYNSTLLVAFIGDSGGFLLSCGDGGIVVRKTEGGDSRIIPVLKSTDDVAVSGVVSLSPDAMNFKTARIGMMPGTRLQVVLASDGVDRSLQRGSSKEEGDIYGQSFREAQSSAALAQVVTDRLGYVAEHEIDNVSAATLHWPVPKFRVAPAPRAASAYLG